MLSRQHCAMLDKTVVRLLRALMRGAASRQDVEGQCIALSNNQVFRYWQLVRTADELRTRRLRMYQSWVREPRHHTQALGAVLGTTKLEVTAGLSRLSESGVVEESATPWARQMWEDLVAVGRLDDMIGWFESLEGSLAPLFAEGSWQSEEFLRFDPQVDRRSVFAVAVSPFPAGPGASCASSSSSEGGFEHFACHEEMCDRSFATFRQLAVHIRTVHDQCDWLYNMVVTNQCPWC